MILTNQLPLYMGTPSSAPIAMAMAGGELGQMVTPASGNRVVPGARWALDNGCFSNTWTPRRWVATLERLSPGPFGSGHQDCLFAVVPDVVGDHKATMDLWCCYWETVIRNGFNLAYVLQDGSTPANVPVTAHALFIGGSTEWKLGPEARACVAAGHARGKWIHMGRVNSERRLRYATDIGCHSVDGTYLAFGPDKNLPKLLSWLNPDQPMLWSA